MNEYYREGGPYSKFTRYRTLRRSRLTITKNLLNTDTIICFTDIKSKRNFCYIVDDFYEWLLQNTECLKTKSWTDDGIYNWPYVPAKYFKFLDNYEVDAIKDNLRVSNKRDYSSFESRCLDLQRFKDYYKHCCTSNFVSDDLVEDGIFETSERAQGFLSWVERTRYHLNKIAPTPSDHGEWAYAADTGSISEKDADEYFKLREIGFIFHENLAHYFALGSRADREYLRNMLDAADVDAYKEGL